jgi:hypothetical protein
VNSQYNLVLGGGWIKRGTEPAVCFDDTADTDGTIVLFRPLDRLNLPGRNLHYVQ